MKSGAVIIGNPNSGSAGDEGYLEGFADALRAGGPTVEVLNRLSESATLDILPLGAAQRSRSS